jgi:hypothetical protein
MDQEKNNREKVIDKFKYNENRIQLVRYIGENCSHWFQLTIQDPDYRTQVVVLDILMSLSKNSNSRYPLIISLSQIEFALDFYPENKNDLDDLSSVLWHGIIRKYSRVGSFNKYEDTEYQGKLGNVRDGSKGLRCYIKNEELVRIELQCNKNFLRKKRMNIENMPINPEHIDIFEYIDWRHGLSSSAQSKLVSTLVRKRFKNIPYDERRSISPRKKKIYLNVLHSAYGATVSRIANSDGTCSPAFEMDPTDRPVAEQISEFKKLKKKYRLTNQVNEFLPKIINIKRRLLYDLKLGYIRRNY